MTSTPQRDRIVFAIGVLGVAGEFGAWLLLGRTPDPTFTLGFFAILGVPTVLGRDERKQQERKP